MIFEKDGKFYRCEKVEKEISEIEFLREKVKELEDKVSELYRRPTYIPFVPYVEPPHPYQPWIITCGSDSTGNNITVWGSQ